MWMKVQFGSKPPVSCERSLQGPSNFIFCTVHFLDGPLKTWYENWNQIKENELFVPFKFTDKSCCGIMDERMKRKYTEMVFHFFQEYFPGTRIYEGKFIKNIAIVRDLRTDRTELIRDLKYSLVLVWSEVSNFCWFWSVTYKPSFEPKNLL